MSDTIKVLHLGRVCLVACSSLAGACGGLCRSSIAYGSSGHGDRCTRCRGAEDSAPAHSRQENSFHRGPLLPSNGRRPTDTAQQYEKSCITFATNAFLSVDRAVNPCIVCPWKTAANLPTNGACAIEHSEGANHTNV